MSTKTVLLSISVALLFIYCIESVDVEFCKKDRNTLRYCSKVLVFNKERSDFFTLLDSDNYNASKDDMKVIVQKDIYPYITTQPNSKEVGGYVGEIWNLIQEYYTFRYTLETSVDYDEGVAMIERGEADVMLANGIAQEYHINIHHTQPYFINWYHLYLKSPETEPSSLSYVNTFSPKLWIFSGCLFSMLTLSVWLTVKLLNGAYLVEPSVSLPSCFLGIVSGFINQGFDLGLRSVSARFQVLIALSFGVVLYSAMNAVLFSQMALSEPSFPFNSLKNIAEKKTHSLCVRTNSFIYNNFTDKNRQILPEWQGVLNNNNCLDINDQANISKILCNNNIIIIENRVIMSNIVSSVHCYVATFHQKMFTRGNVFMLNKGNRHLKTEQIFQMLSKLSSAGILERLENRYIEKQRKKNQNDQQRSYGQCTMAHISSILIMYGVMIAVSLVLLGVEKLWKHSIKQKPYYP